MLIGAIVNFIANPILIFGLHLGVRGSALSTVLAQIVSSTWTIMYFTRGKSLLKLKKVNLKIDFNIVKQILAVGMSPFAMQLAASLVTITFNKSLESYGGDTAIGAMALINSVSMLILMPIFGINQGAQPIIGYNYGAKNYNRVKDTLKYSVIAATCITVLGFIVVELFSVPIIKVFNNTDENLIQMGSQGLRILLIMLPIIGFAIVCTNYFQAIAKAKLSMILSLLRQVILLIPLIIILPNKFELKGVWMAQPIADLMSAIVVGIFIFKEIKGMKDNEVKEIDILSA
jgi:Na+-driven multidrug efflux pump